MKKYFKNGDLKFRDLKNQYFYRLKEALYAENWIVYSKMSFRDKHSVFEYLDRYTHKIAISNAKIKSVTDKELSFEYIDSADNFKSKIRTIKGLDFIKLFLQHILLPTRFTKTRSYGLSSSRNKTEILEKLHQHFEMPKYKKPVVLLVHRYWIVFMM